MDDDTPDFRPDGHLDPGLRENGPDLKINEAGEEFLETIDVGLFDFVNTFQDYDLRINEYAVNVIDGKYEKDGLDDEGNSLDYYLDGATAAFSKVVSEILESSEPEIDGEVHKIVIALLTQSDMDRTRFFNDVVDQTKQHFTPKHKSYLADAAKSILEREPTAGSLPVLNNTASDLAELYFKVVVEKLIEAWRYVEDQGDEDEWQRLISAVEQTREPVVPVRRMGRHILELLKIRARTMLETIRQTWNN